MLDKRGSSNQAERIGLLNRFIKMFGRKKVADREFVGQEWFSFLGNTLLRYYIRIRSNMFTTHKGKQIKAY
jgi:hypothetical protein